MKAHSQLFSFPLPGQAGTLLSECLQPVTVPTLALRCCLLGTMLEAQGGTFKRLQSVLPPRVGGWGQKHYENTEPLRSHVVHESSLPVVLFSTAWASRYAAVGMPAACNCAHACTPLLPSRHYAGGPRRHFQKASERSSIPHQLPNSHKWRAVLPHLLGSKLFQLDVVHRRRCCYPSASGISKGRQNTYGCHFLQVALQRSLRAQTHAPE